MKTPELIQYAIDELRYPLESMDNPVALIELLLGALAEATTELTEAIRLTVEYTGNETLPAVEGWSWFDALRKYAPEAAQVFVDSPLVFPADTPRTIDTPEEADELPRDTLIRERDGFLRVKLYDNRWLLAVEHNSHTASGSLEFPAEVLYTPEAR